ncbi:zinc finger protein 704-like [Agrilus planipennis]|uniref:Zinc finger protein 704-like n=1 Tax=Agrilus planipennis TaxID=224129 RepID=A0A7F5R7T7_AGRPL|nr:zinc finger protein 704-like [Agrilus planipennis]XP_025832032.1 zinc finger protein 704-like [Agrilus planipennis]
MDECSAALVLMSLSGSPHSPYLSGISWGGTSPGSSSSASWRSSPSPPPSDITLSSGPLSTSAASDEGIVVDFIDEYPRKKKFQLPQQTRKVFQCTWRGCMTTTNSCETIEAHVRNDHLKECSDPIAEGEEEFYYTETEVEVTPTSSTPTMLHRDMARPPHEDPEYQRQVVGSFRQSLYSGPINIPQSPHKLLKLSPRPHSPKMPASPRRVRGENKKCRKVYGMENREQWCTQCKWKKACSRFGD